MRRVRIANRGKLALPWRLALAALIGVPLAAPQIAACVGVATYRRHAKAVPEAPDLAEVARVTAQTSRIVAQDGTLLAELPFAGAEGGGAGRRDWLAYEEIPPLLRDAILAAEDVRFFEHDGVDLRAVARAAWTNWRTGRTTSGASTITQQLARNLLPEEIGRERTARRKIREMILARRIERAWSKERIFEAYANLVYLGAGAYGVAAGAQVYFDKGAAELTVDECALLAGLIQAPGRISLEPDAARTRRDEILDRMERAGLLDHDAAAAASETPLALRDREERDPYGTLAPWMTEAARREAEGLDADTFARGGLTIETTVLPVTTLQAEYQAVRGAVAIARRQETAAPQVAAYVIDHRTGYVEAIAGGLDWSASRFDRTAQACRQPGSAFKPIVYAAALERNAITPGTPLRDAPVTEWDEDRGVYWKPKSGRDFRGVALAQDALAASLNAPAIDVLDRVGVTPVVELAARLGLTTRVDPVRPLVLGSSCTIPAELAGAFATFAAGGRRPAPIIITRIRIRDHTWFDRASPYDPFLDPGRRLDRMIAGVAARDTPPALDADSAFLMSAMLAEVVRSGTAHEARALGRPAAGKTGTTNENTDAWFVGYTGRVTAAVWLGHDDPGQHLGPREDGSHAALPVWMDVIQAVEEDRPAAPVPGDPPPGIVAARVDRETGLLAMPGAGGAVDVYFRAGTQPQETVDRIRNVPGELDRLTRQF